MQTATRGTRLFYVDTVNMADMKFLCCGEWACASSGVTAGAVWGEAFIHNCQWMAIIKVALLLL